MLDRYLRIMHAVASTPWAIMPDKLAVILDLLAYRATGERLTDEEIQARIGADGIKPQAVKVRAAQSVRREGGGGVAVLPVRGVIAHRMEAFDNVSGPGGTSTERFIRGFRDAMADNSVSSIVLDVDSPGGGVPGVDEAATEIRGARGDKPIIAVVNSLAASAAYWIASAADEIVVTPSGEVGSIGVFAAHKEFSRRDETLGVKTTLISAGRFKVEGNPFEPLTEEAREAIQARVDEHYEVFVDAVARGRDVAASAVRGGFGEGRTVGAREAVALGMADRIGTMDEEVAQRIGTPAAAAPGAHRVAHMDAYFKTV